jgi:hypothetical protein
VSVQVRYADAEPSGLAQMLGGLIEANLQAHPEREALVARPATFSVRARDAGVDVSIRFTPTQVTIRNGIVGRPNVQIETDSDSLIGLSSVPLKFGFPDAMTKEGRDVNRRLFRGELKVRGLLRHPGKLARLNKLLSVT